MSVTLDQINLGTAPAGKDGDTQRTANSKTNANMAKIADAFTANDAALAGKASADNAALTTGMTVTGAAPVMNLVESDQTAPAGRWRIRAEGGALGVARMTATPSTYTDALSIGANGQVSFASRPSFAAATPWDSANLPRPVAAASANTFLLGWDSNIGAMSLTVDGAAAGSLVRGYPNIFRIYWNGSAADLYVDVVRIGTLATTSDYRVKHGAESYGGALAAVRQVDVLTYLFKGVGVFKDDGVRRLGFFAHNVSHIPGAVQGEKDAVDEEGNIVPQTLSLLPLVAVLFGAVQELAVLNDALRARVEALEAK
ncbi:tail fiber domain-containing protein [Ralstonia syzygii subsp. celebesensis]|uniref:Peptidase S74 domain-containing protein n=2 Tax=Ralstonia syzygii TaxID=28097 RepID=A0A1U9VEV9_9RALS|nr:tail fiber domain-containing protein [Ralstonia syzygii]AQW28805.1 hypothetical protein B0B51_01410 [blood disease bacterium A2-HR MARDI]AQW29035.1 hypothetical protein B0B51_02695 [blood disease bacterium A2-HR MARDI]QQV54422.1 tail fiber domain-containing protein [Ralstonia syzygii subsp. celebesensis]QQV54647.1 tail fiber domain-containing protein [Ralstonia syzygii subsp. celebesensis]